MDLVEDVRHREWPLPDARWILKQTWDHLLFAHWPVAIDQLRSAVPRFLELDLFANQAWLSVTPFKVADLTPRGIPFPVVSAFDEINVRTYVVYDGIPGVYFFSLDANSAMAVGGASTVFHLPYFSAEIHADARRSHVSFMSRRRRGGGAEFDAKYSPAGAIFQPKAGSLDYFLTERYCLYTQDSSANAYRVDIHHAPWELQPAEAQISLNTMANAAGLRLPSTAPVLHYAREQDVLIWFPESLG